MNKAPSLAQKLAVLPKQPGVYLMKGHQGNILYIGKAKVLAKRVRSYFQSGKAVSPRTRSMVSQITDIETVVTASELEALILENNLIKRHRPKYNVVLRDDKNYPLLRLPLQDEYPRLEKVRQIKADGARYFGPYVPAGGLHEMLTLLRKVFPLPNCSIEIDGKLDRPCIEFEIKRCLAPCTGQQSKSDYQEMIAQVRMFLEGKDRILLTRLKMLMKERAAKLDFESAARLRDQIARVSRALEQQRITFSKMEDLDVLAFAQEKGVTALQILFVRGGRVIGKKEFFLETHPETPEAEICTSFLQQFYHKSGIIPKEILVPLLLPETELLETWLSERRGAVVRILSPRRGNKKDLMELARENAGSGLEARLKIRAGGEAQLSLLQEMLHLKRLPRRIEGYDISNTMGTNAVGSMVVFEEGLAKKSDYRHFKIKTIEGANDFGMMAEVLTRRFSQYQKREEEEEPSRQAESDSGLPDLLLIDGGKGQVSAVGAVLDASNLREIDLIGLAKEKGDRGERVYLAGAAEPILLPPGAAATHLLMQVRDEAHRFAVSYHRKLRAKAMLKTPLQEVEGIGPIRRTALLKHFGSLSYIQEASLKNLEDAPSMTQIIARRLYKALHPDDTSERPQKGGR